MSLTQTGPARLPRQIVSLRAIADSAALIIVIYAIMAAIYAYVEPSALSAYAIQSLANNSLPLMLAAAGATFVILQGGFDLSLAGVISLSNVVVAVFPHEGPGGALINLAMALAVGIAVGAVNGYVVGWLKIQSIAATLATMIATQGIALLILDAPGGNVSDFIAYDLTGNWLGVPVAIVVTAVLILFWSLYRGTNAGRALRAVGQDQNAAALSGISVARTRFSAFVWAGAFYGAAGFMLAAQTSTGNPDAGQPFLLLTFAGVALGGAAFGGGRGSLTASLFGAATLMLMQKVLFAVGVSSFYTGIVQGVIMIIAVLFSAIIQYFVSRGNKA